MFELKRDNGKRGVIHAANIIIVITLNVTKGKLSDRSKKNETAAIRWGGGGEEEEEQEEEEKKEQCWRAKRGGWMNGQAEGTFLKIMTGGDVHHR